MLRAFTILDVLIGMVVGGIIMALGMQGFNFLISIQHRASANRETTESYSRVMTVLYHDAEIADSITLENGHLAMYHRDIRLDYQNIDGHVLRNSAHRKDTFLKNSSLEWMLLQDPLNMISVLRIEDEDGWSWTYHKDYAAFPLNQQDGH